MFPAEERHEPIRQSVCLECSIEDAFRLFTEEFGRWWPLASYSVTAEEAESCTMEPWVGGRIFERTRSGEEREWGCITACAPPERLQFEWNPGGQGSRTETVDVEFTAGARGTRVTLIHTGWDAPGVAVCSVQANSGVLWPEILSCWLAFAAQQMLVAV